ncbi:hypothetical protein A6770_37120 [Nostoc minutum NIES-26]|uniref:Thioesterase domain-containing protein n=1 Tax=Nostoc minutum NIES-26 TaxID=1844469 RepID=A0A367RY34_9NOSO|nr:hypothetical protein A6770_37120 [Nostoc minutum NIES-26]
MLQPHTTDGLWEIFAPLLQGIPTVIISNATVQDPQLFIKTLAYYKVTRIILVPSLLRLLLDNYSHLTKKLSQLKIWITSGEVLSVKLVQTFRELIPSAKLINLYGSSEVSANATYYDTSSLPEQANSVPIGRPIDNTQVYVLNRNLQLTPIGVAGELYVGSDGLAKGYLHRSELTQERFLDNPFIPGNKLYKLEDTLEQEKPEMISVEETATRYLQEIRKVQPNGPYLLGGHCYGGVLAFEMAQQLQSQSQTVSLLVIIDAIISETPVESTDNDDAKFLLRIAESIKTDNNIDFSVPFEELRDLPLNEQLHLINKKANFLFSDTEINDFIRNYQLFKAHVQAMRDYVPQVYSHKITLFRANEEIVHDFENPEWNTDDPLLGWGNFSHQPIEMIEIPGDHFSIFVEPYIHELARNLRVCIDNALCKRMFEKSN